MPLVRRFLVVQALLLWQGGFLFYAAVVVPIGTQTLGAFAQGRVTRDVTDVLNLIGAIALAALAWDQWANVESPSCRRTRWALWAVLASMLAGLFVLHSAVGRHVEFAAGGRVTDYPAFYRWHRVYLYVSTVQWVAGLAYTAVTLRAWIATPPAAKPGPT
jgi:hypothetical protein